MYRVRSTDLWFNLPGVVAAYQPVAAPDALCARYNMAHGGDNRYRAEPGTLPAWSSVTGWGFTAASSQYLSTGITPTGLNWTALIRLTNPAWADQWAFGYYTTQGWGLQPNYSSGGLHRTEYYNGAQKEITADRSSGGVWGFAANQGYFNGVVDGTTFAQNAHAGAVVYIGDVNFSGGHRYLTAQVQAFAVYARPLSAAEMWTVSRQLAYCDVNPEWSVWGVRRRWYYYAPSAAAGVIWRGVGRNSSPVGGSPGIGRTP